MTEVTETEESWANVVRRNSLWESDPAHGDLVHAFYYLGVRCNSSVFAKALQSLSAERHHEGDEYLPQLLPPALATPAAARARLERNLNHVANGAWSVWQHFLLRIANHMLFHSLIFNSKFVDTKGGEEVLRITVFMMRMVFLFCNLPIYVSLVWVASNSPSVQATELCCLTIAVTSALTVAVFGREALWFGRRPSWHRDRLMLLRFGLEMTPLTIEYPREGKGRVRRSALGYVSELARLAEDFELDGPVLAGAYDLHAATGVAILRRGSRVQPREPSICEAKLIDEERIKKKYDPKSIMSSIAGITTSLAFGSLPMMACLVATRGRSALPEADNLSHHPSLLFCAVACAWSFLCFGGLFSVAFVGEAISDFRAHRRVITLFMLHVGGISVPEYYAMTGRKLTGRVPRIVVASADDLHTIYAIYTFLREYIQMRTTFHLGALVALFSCVVGASVLFLLSSLGLGLSGAIPVSTLFAFAVCALPMLMFGFRELVLTSEMLSKGTIRYFSGLRVEISAELSRRLVESSSSRTQSRGSPRTESLRAQLSAATVIAEYVTSNDLEIKVLGVSLSSRKLLQALAVVFGSLLSGLMRLSLDI